MPRDASLIETSDRMLTEAVECGLAQRILEDDLLDGRSIRIGGRSLVHFGSCSTLGLELDSRVKRGAIDAVTRFGAHFSSSRIYLSVPLYRELESLLETIFGAPVLVTATTTLGHLAALPILCGSEDLLLLDRQAHHSLQLAVGQVATQGTRVVAVAHNRPEELEQRIQELRGPHRHIWYVGDGVYSMFGDLAPVEELVELLERYPELHLYLDDAHGVSWRGRYGRGYVLDRTPLHARMVVATTLGKSFGTGGAVLVFPNPEWRRRVRTCGGPMLFSGPVPPPLLGAAIASARIHLSDELPSLQARLRDRVRLCNEGLLTHGLPLVAETEVPVRFIGTGCARVAQDLTARLMDDGFYTNLAVFPAVPVQGAGVRLTLTLHQSLEDVRALVEAFARHLPAAVARGGFSLADVRRRFGIPAPSRPSTSEPLSGPSRPPGPRSRSTPASSRLRLRHERAISAMPAAVWNHCLGDRGAFDVSAMRFLERTFSGDPGIGTSWDFHYYMIFDAADEPVLATVFSDGLWKDDMLASEAVSRLAEERRREDPGYLTSRVFSMGCLLTEGRHLYVDRERDWRSAMSMLLDAVDQQAKDCGASMLVLRDLSPDDEEMDVFLAPLGFTKTPTPESFTLEIDWTDDSGFLERLSPKARRHQQREVLAWEGAYETELMSSGGRTPSPEELAHYRRLYREVKGRSLELNTFELPESFFERVLGSASWELTTFRLRPEFGGDPAAPVVAVGAGFVGETQYVPTVLGLDYRYVYSHGLYRVCLLKAMRRAQELGLRRVRLGMGAPLEKRRFGARAQTGCLYLRTATADHFDALAALMAEAGD